MAARSAISGGEESRRELVSIDQLPPNAVDRIRVDHPALTAGALISRAEAASYRRIYIEELLQADHGELTELDRQVAERANQGTITEKIDTEYEEWRTLGERLSESEPVVRCGAPHHHDEPEALGLQRPAALAERLRGEPRDRA